MIIHAAYANEAPALWSGCQSDKWRWICPQLSQPFDYWNAMVAIFLRDSAFLNVEHDNIVTAEQVAEVEACPEPLCAFAYSMSKPTDLVPHVKWFAEQCIAGDHRAGYETLLNLASGRDCLALGATRFSADLVGRMRPAILAHSPVGWREVETAVFECVPKDVAFHRHYPNAIHVGHFLPDTTGLDAHILPGVMRGR